MAERAWTSTDVVCEREEGRKTVRRGMMSRGGASAPSQKRLSPFLLMILRHVLTVLCIVCRAGPHVVRNEVQ